jgi:hypothetical protein
MFNTSSSAKRHHSSSLYDRQAANRGCCWEQRTRLSEFLLPLYPPEWERSTGGSASRPGFTSGSAWLRLDQSVTEQHTFMCSMVFIGWRWRISIYPYLKTPRSHPLLHPTTPPPSLTQTTEPSHRVCMVFFLLTDKRGVHKSKLVYSNFVWKYIKM